MKLAILSDIHDNLWNLQAAIQAAQGTDILLCCGDLCSPFVIDELVKFAGDVHIVFGNNDADLYRITSKASKVANCHLHGELFETAFDGKRFAVNHFDYLARPMAKSGNYDVVCFGHNHELEISRAGECRLINPGPVMGAKFSSGRWEDVAPTFVIYDTASDTAEVRNITKPGRR
ncbi:MAG TPA: metallophosphoesterase family protein [Bryobacteraceae bacterium]|nr:metallophosphoesterase family protein [Bryobacteraceae bacterium]